MPGQDSSAISGAQMSLQGGLDFGSTPTDSRMPMEGNVFSFAARSAASSANPSNASSREGTRRVRIYTYRSSPSTKSMYAVPGPSASQRSTVREQVQQIEQRVAKVQRVGDTIHPRAVPVSKEMGRPSSSSFKAYLLAGYSQVSLM